MSSISIFKEQCRALKTMLNFNNKSIKSTNEPVWKVLIYDQRGQDIISPLLNVKELRDLGVTLHLHLHSQRDSVQDVPALYFVLPTDDNINRICQDLRDHLYESYYFNFISPISRQHLEDLATASIYAEASYNVKKIYDQYLNFISLEDDMFILRHSSIEDISYYAINRADARDSDIETVMNNIADGLFSFFVTLGIIPIIRCPSGNAAEMVAEKLYKKLKNSIQNIRSGLFNSGDFSDINDQRVLTFQRPLLVILDRNMDMATPLHHTWTYQALVHDVLDLRLNQVRLQDSNSPRSKISLLDLNVRDKFWQANKGTPFPKVAELVQEELEAYRASEDEVKRLKTDMGLEGDTSDGPILLSDNTAKLTSAVSSLPELLKRKESIDMHTTIATAVLNHIKKRKLDNFFELEEKIMSKSLLDKSPLDLISDPNFGCQSDKMRLFLIYYLCSSIDENDLKSYETALKDAGCDCSALAYMKKWKSFTKMPVSDGQYSGGTKTVNMFSKLMSQGSQFVMEGVKNVVVKKHWLPITRIVDGLMDSKSFQETEDYKYFDPKSLKTIEQPKTKASFQDAIVFVVGGGNYIEYQNLMEYSKSKTNKPNIKRIIYGCTELMNADQFLKQLSALGRI